MRNIPYDIKNKLMSMQQTLANDADPRMLLKLQRGTIPITDKRLWQYSTVDSGSCTVSSVTVRRSKKDVAPDFAYVAFVRANTLYVKIARIEQPVKKMSWTVVETIANVSKCSLVFNGSYVQSGLYNTEFVTEEEPWLFYTNLSGELFGGVLGTTYSTIVGSGVVDFDAARAIASLYKDIDQGMMIFYILNGYVYFRQYINDTWQDQQSVSLAPENAVSIKADRTFDWRIVLQVQDNTGALHEVLSRPYYSGWVNVENLTMKVPSILLDVKEIQYISAQSEDEYLTATVSGITIQPKYALSPVMKSAYNAIYTNAELEVENDYGYKVVIEFDEIVDSVSTSYNSFVLEDSTGQIVYPFAAESITGRTIAVYFMNFNNAVGEVTVSYNGTGLVGEIGQSVDADSVSFTPTGLVPFYVAPPVVVGITNIQDWEVPS